MQIATLEFDGAFGFDGPVHGHRARIRAISSRN